MALIILEGAGSAFDPGLTHLAPTWFSRLSRISRLHGCCGPATPRPVYPVSGDDDKKRLRKVAQGARADAHRCVNAEPALSALVTYIDAVPTVETVSGYAAMRSELDPEPALLTLHDLGYRICLPVVIGAGKPLIFRQWTPEAAMTDGAFGARIPAEGEEVAPELLITPLLAFDGEGYRLGYGGGFYDRTLAALGAERRVYSVGLAYDSQRVAKVPRGPFDKRLDAIVTEKNTYYGW